MSKESLLIAQQDAQQILKHHQKLLQQFPPNSQQRKSYEAIFEEMKKATEYRYAF